MSSKRRSPNAIKKQAHALIAWHMHNSDHSTMDTFRRLIAKALGKEARFKNLAYSDQSFQPIQLRRIQRNGSHDETGAARIDEPPIIFLDGVRFFVLDGQKRINDWNRAKDKEPKQCILIRTTNR